MWKMNLASLAIAATAMVVYPAIADARPGGGGARGQARASVGGGGGGARATHASRPAPQRQSAGNYGGQANRQAAVSNRSGNTVRGGGNVNRSGNRVNTGNINVGNNVNVNVDHDNGWGWGDRDYHPVAAGMAFGTAAAVTSAAINGARYYSLPPSCAPYPYSGYTYYSCGGVYYAPQYEGDTVVYVVVDRPG